MGYIEIIRPDGSGFSNRTSDELLYTTFMFCDKCESVVDTTGGKYVADNQMWWCKDCR